MPSVHAHVRVVLPNGTASRGVDVAVPEYPIRETEAETAAAVALAASQALQRAASDVIATLDLPDPTPVVPAADTAPQS